MENNEKKNSGFLNRLEKLGNRLPDPSFLFIFLALVVIIASAIAAYFGLSVTYEGFNADTGTIETITATVNNLLSAEGIQYMVTNVITNFTSFFPLGTVFTIILGVSVAEGTGMLSALLKRIVSRTPQFLISAMVVFLGISSNIASSTGYIVMVPLGAIIFLASKRHPVAGIAAAFAGVSGGWTANLLIGANDPLYAGISTQAAQMLDPSYLVNPTANWYFMVISTFLITAIGTFVTDKIVEPKLPEYHFTDEDEVNEVEENEIKGLKYAGIAELIYVVIIGFMVIPQGAILRNPETGGILTSPFMSGIIFFMMLFFLIPGIAYGLGAGTITQSKDITGYMTEGIKGISNFLVLIFFAAQFTAFFSYSNLGTILSVYGARLLTDIGLTGLPLILIFIIVTGLINLLMPVDTAKWAMMAPIFIPMFMQLNLSPELTQVAFRIGDSTTNIITPLMPFFPMIMAYIQRYDEDMGIGSITSTMLPYSISFLIGWVILISLWYFLGLPLGPGAPLTL